MFCLLQKSKFSFNSVVLVLLVVRFQSYRNFSTNEMNMLETEFTLYQSLQLDEISSQVRVDAAIRVALAYGDEQFVYRLDV